MTEVGLLLFPGLTQLDLTGPFEVLSRLPETQVHLVWKTTGPVTSDRGLTLLPTTGFDDCPPLDVLVVPGGFGVQELLLDEDVLDFLRAQAAVASRVGSVCTGALVLGAAGLLDGYRATTHWAYLDLLEPFGAAVAPGRVVVDRDRITGGGITAGIDVALSLAAALAGEPTARAIELQMEYDPAPPFGGGHPDRADPAVLAEVRAQLAPLLAARRTVVDEAARRRSSR